MAVGLGIFQICTFVPAPRPLTPHLKGLEASTSYRVPLLRVPTKQRTTMLNCGSLAQTPSWYLSSFPVLYIIYGESVPPIRVNHFLKMGHFHDTVYRARAKAIILGGRLHCLYPTAYCLDISRALSKGTMRLSHHIITALRELTQSKQQATVFRPRTTLSSAPVLHILHILRAIDRITRPRPPSRPTTPLNLVRSLPGQLISRMDLIFQPKGRFGLPYRLRTHQNSTRTHEQANLDFFCLPFSLLPRVSRVSRNAGKHHMHRRVMGG